MTWSNSLGSSPGRLRQFEITLKQVEQGVKKGSPIFSAAAAMLRALMAREVGSERSSITPAPQHTASGIRCGSTSTLSNTCRRMSKKRASAPWKQQLYYMGVLYIV